jgi:hypothetical protein
VGYGGERDLACDVQGLSKVVWQPRLIINFWSCGCVPTLYRMSPLMN